MAFSMVCRPARESFRQSMAGRPSAEIAALFKVAPTYVNLIRKRGRDKLTRIVRELDTLDGGADQDGE